MNTDHTQSLTATTPPTAQTRDTSGKPVDVVERDIKDKDDPAKAVDEVITPSSNRAKEQDVEELEKKTAEIERKVADGN